MTCSTILSNHEEGTLRSFDYEAPTSVDQAVALLAAAGPRARPMAGGTDLLVQMRRGLQALDLVVDVKRIPELNEIVFDPRGGLTFGAAVSCARLCEEPEVRRAYPGLVDAVSLIGGTAVQNRATVGGNLCNASPSGDSIPALIVYGAQCTIAGLAGRRAQPVQDFCLAPGRNILSAGEMLISIHLPAPQPHAGGCYVRFIPRHEMDIAVAGAGAWLALSEDQAQIVGARVALAAVASTPLLVQAAGEALAGMPPREDAFAEAARLAQEAACPITDVRGTAPQRRHLVGVLTRRALHGAWRRATGRPVATDEPGGSHEQ